MSKVYKSLYVPEIEIDLANYLTELLIGNFINMKKWNRPACPFWRKEICENDDTLLELSKRYSIELAAMKNLLKVFDGDIIAKCITENRKVGFKLLKKENQAIFLYELFNLQIKKPALSTKVPEITTSAETVKTFSSSKKKITL